MCSPNSCLLLNVRDDTGIHVIVDQSSSHSWWKFNYLSTMIINSCISGFRCFASILPYNLKSCWHTRAKAKVLLGAVNPPPQSWVLSLWVLSLQKQCLLFRKPMQQHWGWQKAFMPSSSWNIVFWCFLTHSISNANAFFNFREAGSMQSEPYQGRCLVLDIIFGVHLWALPNQNQVIVKVAKMKPMATYMCLFSSILHQPRLWHISVSAVQSSESWVIFVEHMCQAISELSSCNDASWYLR